MENICSYGLTFFIEAIILFQYASHLFNSKHTVKKRIFLLIMLYILLFVVSLLNIKWLNMILYITCNFIFLFSEYNVSFFPSLFHSGILAGIMCMSELIVYSIIEHFTPHFFYQSSSIYNKILFIILSKILFFLIIYVLLLFTKVEDKEEYFDPTVILLFFIPLATIFVMLTFIYICDAHALMPVETWLISLTSLLLLFINLSIFAINQYSQKKKVEYMEIQLRLQKESAYREYYSMLLAQTENHDILIHDIKKHLHAIEILSNQGDIQNVSKYVEQLLLSSDLNKYSRFCNNELLNSILFHYQELCNNKEIDFHVDIRNKAVDFIADNDLTSLFCNLLDNALEASIKTSKPFIEIRVTKEEATPYITIFIVNSCSNAPSYGNNGMLLTSKSNKSMHGLGEKSIHRIISKYQGYSKSYYDNESKIFHYILALNYQTHSHFNSK